jgi:class 3 adenylate cyclase
MNRELLHERILEAAGLECRDTEADCGDFYGRFEEVLAGLSGWELFRMNPLDLAAKAGLDVEGTIAAFVYGAKVGLFGFEWSLLCPYCGGREHSAAGLDSLEQDSYHCTLCDIDLGVTSDANMEVSFTMVPAVAEWMPSPLEDIDSYFRYHRSANFIPSPAMTRSGPRAQLLSYAKAGAGKRLRWSFAPAPGKKYRVITFDFHSMVRIDFGAPAAHAAAAAHTAAHAAAYAAVGAFAGGEDGPPAITHRASGFDSESLSLPERGASVDVINAGTQALGLIAVGQDTGAIRAAVATSPAGFRPFLTGKRVLNNQAFRDLFLLEGLPRDLHLRVDDLTLLFTDLKGSTEMYEATGDIVAFRLVKRHFAILRQVVVRHRGALVKTMGDAIMASFCAPAEGIAAAMDMLAELDALNAGLEPRRRALVKIGLHAGPALAVKANQTLDYFGQAVNMAARIQALAEAEEIVLSSSFFAREGVEGLVAGRGFGTSKGVAQLKGISEMLPIVRLSRSTTLA